MLNALQDFAPFHFKKAHIRLAPHLRPFKTSRTNCFAVYEQRTLHGALVATLLRLLNCCFIIIIIEKTAS